MAGFVPAHPEDSLALAEHLVPEELNARIKSVNARPEAPGSFLQRAWLYNEYALATPGWEGDEAMFRLGRRDLQRIIGNETLGPRHKVRVGAEMLFAYEGAFRVRAKGERISPGIRRGLQARLGDLTLRFTDAGDLTPTEHGQLSELIAATYLMDTPLFPYLASNREECNMYRADNHDFYTTHYAPGGRIKKAPLSIKFTESHAPGIVLTLAVGKLAALAAERTPVYRDENLDPARAQRLAADIMVCHTIGDPLSQEDAIFKSKLTELLYRPIVAYAKKSSVPDYASNAEALRQQLGMRIQPPAE